MAPLIAGVVELATLGGRALWGLFRNTGFQTGLFSGWLVFQDDDERSGLNGAVIGFGLCLALLAVYLVYQGLVKLGVVKKKRR